MSFLSLMNNTVDIETTTETKSPSGAVTKSWASKVTGAACRVETLSAQAMIDYQRFGYAVTHKVYFPVDHSLTINDRIVFGGACYYVRSIDNAGGHVGHHWEVLAEKKASL